MTRNMTAHGLHPARHLTVLALLSLGHLCSPAQSPPFAPPALPPSAAQSLPLADLPPSPLQQARAQFHQGDLEAAQTTLQSYLSHTPNSADALYLLGELLMRRNQAPASLDAFTRAAALRPPTGDQLRLVALDYILLNDNTDAVLWLNRATALDPNNPDIWYSLGRAQYSKGDFAAAEASFRKTVSLNPLHPERNVKAFDNLALALAAQDRSTDAFDAFRTSIRLQENSPQGPEHPYSEQPYLDYGLALIHANRLPDAAAVLARSTAVAPRCAPCHDAAGQALLALDRLPEAQAELIQATTLDPNNPRYHFELGRLYKRTGDAAKSAAELQRSAQLYGSHSTPSQ